MFVKPNRRRGQGGKFPSAVPVCETGFDDWCPPRLPSWEGGGGQARRGALQVRCCSVAGGDIPLRWQGSGWLGSARGTGPLSRHSGREVEAAN